ncbi:MAG: TonB-dependent receptor [Sphingobium sp.]
MKRHLKTAFITSTVLSLCPALAHAQDNTAQARQQPSSVNDIIVTATRRATSMQQVSATIDVASAEKLDALKIDDAGALEAVVPGITVARSGGVTPFIRGIGTFNAGFSEASVGVYIDGLYLPNSTGVLFSFNNVERIEVLKGPQGTLYGRNTTGGLINIITEQPGKELAVDASVGYANYDTFSQKLYANVPLGDNFAANVAVFHEKQSDGWSKNVTTGNDVQKSEETGLYGKLQWDGGDGTKITLSGLYNYSNGNKGWAFAIMPGSYGTDGTPYLGEYRMANRADPSAKYKGYLTSLKIEHEFPFADFFSLTGYQWGGQVSNLTQNGMPGNPVAGQGAQNVFIDFDYKTFSQEFQLSSNTNDSPFNWVVGAYYYHDDTEVTTSLTTTCVDDLCAPLPGNAPPTITTTKPTTRSVSGYADGTYDITPSTHLTAGIRYTHEKKGFDGLVSARPGFPNSVTDAGLPPTLIRTPEQAGIPASMTFDKITFRGVLTQDLSDHARVYASFNRGFKSGNYNPNVVNQRPVDPEFLDAYEIGLKSELLDNRLRLNISGFYYDYTDIQVRSNVGLPAGAPSIAQNVGAARTKGVDVQIDFTPIPDFTISGGFEYLDAEYKDFPGTACSTPAIPSEVRLGGAQVIPCTGPKGPNNLAGYPLPVSPKYSGNLTFNYRMDSDIGEFRWVMNNSYKSRYTLAPDSSVIQGKTLTIDASLNWTAPNGRLYGQVFVRNLTDVYRYAAGQSASTFVYVPGEPRTYGVTVGFRL